MTKEKTITTVVIKARYNAGQIPPLTPEMELLGLLFDWKMLGGPIGQGLQWNTLDEYLSDKSGPRLKDWHIVEDENIHFYRKILPDDQISIVTSKHSRNLSPKKLDVIQNAMHNMMPLLHSSELRQLCIEGEKNTNGKLTEWCPRPLYEKWQNYVFDNLIEAHTDRLLEKIAIEIIHLF